MVYAPAAMSPVITRAADAIAAVFSFWSSLEKSMSTHTLRRGPRPRGTVAQQGKQSVRKARTGEVPAVLRRSLDECWWRWGRIELPVQNTFPENFLQVFPANLRFRVADPRPAGCLACYPVMPLGSLTPLTGVGDAAPPLMTSSPSGEVGRRRCSLRFRQRGRNCRCQLQACSLFTRPASILGLRFPAHGPCRNLTSPRTDRTIDCTRP